MHVYESMFRCQLCGSWVYEKDIGRLSLQWRPRGQFDRKTTSLNVNICHRCWTETVVVKIKEFLEEICIVK